MADSPTTQTNGHVQLASAVIIQDISPQPASPPPPQPSTNGASLKRRASDLPSDNDDKHTIPDTAEDPHAKRARLDPANLANGSPTPASPSSVSHPIGARPRPARPAADADADRKRGKRLFGSLLGTLSQSATAGAAQKRRAEVERKQRDKLAALSSAGAHSHAHAGDASNEIREQPGSRRRTAEELAALERQRREQQRLWAEDEMRARHASMRARARFLCTKVEPKIYWLPYELTGREERNLDEQRENVERVIAREEEEARQRQNGNDDREMEEAQKTAVEGGEVAAVVEGEVPQEHDETMDLDRGDDQMGNGDRGDEASASSAGQNTAAVVVNSADDTKDNVEDEEEIPLNGNADEDTVIY